LFNDNDIDMLW